MKEDIVSVASEIKWLEKTADAMAVRFRGFYDRDEYESSGRTLKRTKND